MSHAVQSPPRRRRAPGKRGKGKIIALCLAAFLLLSCGLLYWAYARLDNNIDSVDLEKALGNDRPEKIETGARDILVVGSDSRAGAENKQLGGGVNVSGGRSDTTMVVHIPEGRRRATVVSIPRDTLVTRPHCQKADGSTLPKAERVMFNSVYALGGPACVVKTVESMTKVRMDHYMEVDFAGFKELVDALGGVTLDLEEPIDSPKTGLVLDAGSHKLDGAQSLAFVRTRYGYKDGSDLGRIGLQQQFILALLDEVKNQDLTTSPTKLYTIADTATQTLTTDEGLNSVRKLASFGRSLQGLDTGNMDMIMMPVMYDKQDPNRVVAKEPLAGKVWDAVRNDRPLPAEATEKAAE
ncbi:putative cell wall biosynthesis protein LcpB [Streptomyces sp. RB5]|uniref:Putative cell wall biosynthesis protein LcpB n=1 Tax=Streptomyces smaragdinus TaxID=2585196 RepID=A0A7K0CQ07_9ACTN|nr:LCP family protein [Streptomyces smaragdinus]MQY15576.1 putative cell wall biosynthesis protein LcpB [Streptomyces smaragdinus]